MKRFFIIETYHKLKSLLHMATLLDYDSSMSGIFQNFYEQKFFLDVAMTAIKLVMIELLKCLHRPAEFRE